MAETTATKKVTPIPPYSDKITSMIRYNTRYSYILLPNESVQMPYDFVITDISKNPPVEQVSPQVWVPAAWAPDVLLPDARNILFNITIDDRELLFRNDAPYLAIPSYPQKYQMPCLWYLPRGSHVKFTADNMINVANLNQHRIAPIIVSATAFDPAIHIGGYFVEEPPAEIRTRLFRPLVMVFMHYPRQDNSGMFPLQPANPIVAPSCPALGTLGNDDDFKVQNLSLPTDRNFLIKKWSYCAVRDTSIGFPPAVTTYTAQVYDDYTGRFSYNGSFYITDKTERIDAIVPNHNWPFESKKLMRVTGGNSVTIESSYIRGAGVPPIGSLILCNFVLVGGILVHKI